MSDVKRLNFTVSQFENVVPYASEHGQYVRYVDYARLEAEAQALRDQVKALQSDANSYQSGYNEGRRMGTKHRQDEVEQLTREVEALRARVVVVPNDLLQRCREVLGWQKTGVLKGDALRSLGRKRWLGDPNELHLAENETAREAYRFIDELACLNGKAVSEGLLREAKRHLGNWLELHECECEGGFHYCGREQVAKTHRELRALLDEEIKNEN